LIGSNHSSGITKNIKRIIKLIRPMKYSPAIMPLRSGWRILLVILIKKEILSNNYGGLSK
jgi:hypothetical protein